MLICITTKRELWYTLFPKLLCVLYGVHWRTRIEWSLPECWCSGGNSVDISESHFYVNIPKGLQSLKSKTYNFNKNFRHLTSCGRYFGPDHPSFTQTIPYKLKLVFSKDTLATEHLIWNNTSAHSWVFKKLRGWKPSTPFHY